MELTKFEKLTVILATLIAILCGIYVFGNKNSPSEAFLNQAQAAPEIQNQILVTR